MRSARGQDRAFSFIGRIPFASFLSLLIATAFTILDAGTAHAACGATECWNAPSGIWSNGANWTPAGPPTSAITVQIGNGGAATVDATKEVDPQAEGRWRVTVARDDVPHALAVMRSEELPRARPPGVLDAVGKGALVPSEAAEHAQLVAGLDGELERTLEGIDGVLRARVHLSVPARSPPSVCSASTK